MAAAVFPSFPTSDGTSPGVMVPYAMPLAVPAGIPTWELTTLLPTNREETERVPLRFATPFVLTGLLPTIVLTNQEAWSPLPVDPAHFWVKLDVDKKVYFTAEGSETNNATPQTNYVTLSAVSVLVRLFNLHLQGATPQIGVTFRSKHAAGGNSGLPNDARLCLSAFGYECDRDGNPIPLVR